MINDLKRKLLTERVKKSELVPVMTTFIGELERMQAGSKFSVTQDVVVKLAKKFIENNNSCINAPSATEEVRQKLLTENTWLETLIPVQLNEIQIINIAVQYPSIGEFMRFMNTEYPGQFDRNLASEIFRRTRSQ